MPNDENFLLTVGESVEPPAEIDKYDCFEPFIPQISVTTTPKLAQWAFVHLKAGYNNKLALKYLMDELVIRTWIEEP